MKLISLKLIEPISALGNLDTMTIQDKHLSASLENGIVTIVGTARNGDTKIVCTPLSNVVSFEPEGKSVKKGV